jgi:hypothetical protein
MKTSEVLSGLMALGITLADVGDPKQALLEWTADGLLIPPEGLRAGEEEWPAATLAEAAALHVMIFRYGFQKDAMQAVRTRLINELREAHNDMTTVVDRIAEDAFYDYLPSVLYLIAYGKARLGIPIYEIAQLETWTDEGKVHFRRVGPEFPDSGKHPRIFEKITGRRVAHE